MCRELIFIFIVFFIFIVIFTVQNDLRIHCKFVKNMRSGSSSPSHFWHQELVQNWTKQQTRRLMRSHCVSKNVIIFFYFCDIFVRFYLILLVFRRKIPRGNLTQTHIHGEAIGVDSCAPAWELMDDTSNTCSDNMNVTWQLSDVTIWLLWVDFVFDTVGLLYAVKIVARFYTLQYEHMKGDAVACAFVFVSNFLEYVSAKNWQSWTTFN